MEALIWFLVGSVGGMVVAGLVVTVLNGRRQNSIQNRLAAEEAISRGLRETNADLERRLAESASDQETLASERDAARREGETARIETARIEADLRLAREKHEEFARGADEARKKLEEMFKALATDVLQANQKQFLENATAHFEKAQKQIGGHLGERNAQFEEMLKPFKEQISKQQETLQQLL